MSRRFSNPFRAMGGENSSNTAGQRDRANGILNEVEPRQDFSYSSL